MNTLKEKIKQLKLAGISKSLDQRNQYALENKLSYIDFLELLVEDEYANRMANSYRKRYSRSRLSEQKLLQTYDFSYQKELDQKLIREIAGCRFINEKKNVVFMGKPGTGKTHLANAIGIEALKQGYKVIFIHASELIDKLNSSRADGSFHGILNQYLNVDLLVIDELGFKKVSQLGLDDFFEIIRRRYEQGSIIITSNRNFEDWGDIFGDQVLASAIIDRVVHHAYIIKITGESYRIKEYV